MAGPFYVDLGSPGSWQGRDGTNSASPWLGISGCQKALDTVVAGETCYLTGTGDLSKFYTVTYDASSGTTLTDGEEVTWDNGEGAWADGTDKGIVRVAVSTAGGSGTVEIELTTGTMPADNDVIKGSTSTQTITRAATANARKSLDVDTQAGTNASGPVKFIGVDADWSGRTSRAIIDGASGTDTHGVTVAAAIHLRWWENIEVKRIAGSSKCGFAAVGYGPSGHTFINCCVNNCTGSGFAGASGYFKDAVLIRCVAYSNGVDGISISGCLQAFCCSRQNTRTGYYPATNTTLIGCIGWYNTVNGLTCAAVPVTIFNGVFDNNQAGGIAGGSTTANVFGLTILGTRITSQNQAGTDWGIDFTNDPAIIGWSYFEDNGDAAADDMVNDGLVTLLYEEGTTTDSNRYGLADTDEGYVSHPALPGTPDLSTDYDADNPVSIRRTAITIPWS